jgi:hypothetical protein
MEGAKWSLRFLLSNNHRPIGMVGQLSKADVPLERRDMVRKMGGEEQIKAPTD